MQQSLSIKGIHKHFKGKYYLVLDTFESASEGPMIVGYRPMYSKQETGTEAKYWRTQEDFTELVRWPDQIVRPRFCPVTEVNELNRAYRYDTCHLNNPAPDISHPAYQQILAKGEAVVISILIDLRRGAESGFQDEDSCEPLMYLSILYDLTKNVLFNSAVTKQRVGNWTLDVQDYEFLCSAKKWTQGHQQVCSDAANIKLLLPETRDWIMHAKL